MDRKDQISYRLLCNACLCVGQGLKLITGAKLKQFYLDALNEIPLERNISDITPVLCWDCEALLHRAMRFKEQVKSSYQTLLTYTSEDFNECFSSKFSRAQRIQIVTNDTITISPECFDDARVKSGSTVKNEVKIDWHKASSEIPALKAMPDKLQQIYLNDDLKTVHGKALAEVSDTHEVAPDRTQQIYLNDDVKMEYERVADSDNAADLEYPTDALTELTAKKKKKKKGIKEKRSKREKKTKKSMKEREKILTIELSYEDMMLERDRDKDKEAYVNAEYKCDTCIIGFNYYKSFKTHLTSKHSQSIGDYSCPVCKTIYASVDSFTSHYKRHIRRYECNICQKRTMDLKVMQQHYYSAHEISLKEYKCDECGKISNSVDSHRYHKESHKARLQCLECDKTFRHRAGLLNHRLAVHEYKNKFPCNICNKIFKWRTSLRRHQETHENKEPSAAAAYCALCGVSFSSICSYQRHMNNSLKHITKDQLRFICDHCNIKFADKTKLRDHIEEKHLHKTFECHICHKTSKNRVGLDQHIRNVHKGRPNNKICHHCGKAFPTKVQLESHIRTHTGERPFICEYCPTTFSQQSNLYKHNRQVHLNLKSKRYPACKKKSVSPQEPVPGMNQPPAISVVLHYSETGFLTAEL